MMARSYRVGCASVALLLVIGLAHVGTATGGSAVEELAKRLPDNLIGLAATSGSDALTGDFEKTAVGRIWNDQGVQTFYRSIKTALLSQLKQKTDDPNAAQEAEDVLRYVRLALSRPLMIGVAQVQVQQGPPICAFAVINAGTRKAELSAAVGKVEAMAGEGAIVDTQVGSLKLRGIKGPDDVPLYWGWVEDHFIFAVNDAQGTAAQYVTSPRATASTTLGKVPPSNDALVVYCNYPKLASLITSLIQEEEGEEGAALLTAAAKSLGLASMGNLVARVGFAGPDLVGDALMEMTMPPTGVFAAYKTVDPSWLAAVDPRAVTATVVNLDVVGLYDLILNTVKAVSPDEGYPQVQSGIAAFEAQTQVQIRGGLLNSLAGPALFYTLPAGKMSEAPRGGFVAIAALKDARQFEKAVTALGDFAGAQSQGMLQVSSQTRDDGRIVHVWAIAPLAMMSVMPTWSIANDHVVLGSTKELCDLGVKQFAAKGPDKTSLLNTDGYKKAAAGLPKDLVSLTYTDSGTQLDQTMMQIQQVWPMLTMGVMQAGVKLPVLLPSLSEIAKDLGPGCGYNYFSPEGMRWHYRGPGVEGSQIGVGGAAVGAAVLMPALARGRQKAYVMTSATNLSCIGKACLIYANDYDDKLPPDLQTLVTEAELSPMALESKRKPKGFDGPSYIYVAGQTAEMYPGNIVAYENPAFCQDNINVLFLDSHVELMKPDAFRHELEATYEKLGRQMPEIRFKGEKVKPTAPTTVEPSQT